MEVSDLEDEIIGLETRISKLQEGIKDIDTEKITKQYSENLT